MATQNPTPQPQVTHGSVPAVNPPVAVRGPLGSFPVRAGGEPVPSGLPTSEQQAAQPDPVPAKRSKKG